MGNFGGIVFGLILICFGIGAILGINVWRYFFPTLLILFGISLLFNQTTLSNKEKMKQTWGNVLPVESSEDTINYDTVFGGVEKKLVSKNFRGGKVSSVFSSTVIDLREARVAKNQQVSLEVNAVFGGVKVIVPESWAVEGNLSGVFGGFENTTRLPEKPEARIFIKGAAVFGGGEITN